MGRERGKTSRLKEALGIFMRLLDAKNAMETQWGDFKVLLGDYVQVAWNDEMAMVSDGLPGEEILVKYTKDGLLTIELSHGGMCSYKCIPVEQQEPFETGWLERKLRSLGVKRDSEPRTEDCRTTSYEQVRFF